MAESAKLWTVKSTLEWTRDYLQRKGDPQPRLSAEWLLCAATGLSRVEVYMNYDRPLDAGELKTLHDGVARRGRGEPLQYVTGEMPFRHIVLRCAPGVLIPRPETELLVDEVLTYVDQIPPAAPSMQKDSHAEVEGETEPVQGDGPIDDEDVQPTPRPDVHVLEVGVGTGCVSLSIASERPRTSIVATDISHEAVALATRNRDALGLSDRVQIVECDLASAVPQAKDNSFDVLVSNPPYIPSAILPTLPREVGGFEPALALDGGPDGLDVFRRLVELGVGALRPGGLLACELHEECLVAASRELGVLEYYEDVRIVRDLTGRDRFLCAKLRG